MKRSASSGIVIRVSCSRFHLSSSFLISAVFAMSIAVMTGEELTREVVSGTDTVTEARNEGLKTHTYGNTMVVTGWLIMRGRSGGKPFERRYRFTDTWLKRGGQWQIIAAQDYLVPAGAR